MLKLDGQLSITRIQGGGKGTRVRIRLEDSDARVTAVEVEMGLAEFAEALTGLCNQDCSFEFNGSGKVGTVGENKEELVPVPAYGSRDGRTEDWKRVALAPFEVDGWRARSGDLGNHHHWIRDKENREFYRVVFFRNVPKPAKDAA